MYFETADQATAALAANGHVDMEGKTLIVTKLRSLVERQAMYMERVMLSCDTQFRVVIVRNLKPQNNEQQLRDHFAACGEIDHVLIVNTPSRAPYAFVAFVKSEDAQKALTLHGSLLDDVTIGVFMRNFTSTNTFKKDPARTIMLNNKQHLRKYN